MPQENSFAITETHFYLKAYKVLFTLHFYLALITLVQLTLCLVVFVNI